MAVRVDHEGGPAAARAWHLAFASAPMASQRVCEDRLMELLEREEALAGLEFALGEVRAGAGMVVLVSGEAGIGKTSLIRAFLARVPDDVPVLVGGCDDLAVPRALGPFHEIPELARRLDEEPAAAPSIVLGQLRGVVCVIEDAHWADQATLDVLGYVARRVESASSTATRRCIGTEL